MRASTAMLVAVLAIAGCDRAPPPAPAPTHDAGWSSLDAQVRRYPAESGLFTRSVIAPALKRLLGARYAVLIADTEVSGPLQREAGILYVTGNRAHRGGSDAAYVLIDPRRRALRVGLWRDGTLSTFATPGTAIATPRDVDTMIANTDAAPR